MDITQRIKQQVDSKPVVLYMKGTPDFPQCGFSARASQALKACDADFAYINIFEEPEIRTALPKFSNWPTFPQLFINGELIGGSDIVADMYQSGELQKLIQQAATA